MKARRFKKRYTVILGIILFFALLLFAAPRAGKWYVVKHSNELVGRKLATGKLRFNYFTGTLGIHDLQLFETDAKEVLVSFKRLKINLKYMPLFRNEIFVNTLSMTILTPRYCKMEMRLTSRI